MPTSGSRRWLSAASPWSLAYLDGARRPEDGRLDRITDVIPTLERFFTGRGSGLDAATLHLSKEAAERRGARIAALTKRLIGR